MATTVPHRPFVPNAPSPSAPPEEPASPAAVRRGECHYCGSGLPKGRSVTFCPHCGEDVTIRHCPACSAELDVGWRFCVCCGRGVAKS